MTAWIKCVAVCVALGVAGAGPAAPAQAAGSKGSKKKRDEPAAADVLKGRIASVSGADGDGVVTIVVQAGGGADARRVTVEANADTRVTSNGQTVAASALKPGQQVKVSPSTGTARTIEATGKAASARHGRRRGAGGRRRAAAARVVHVRPGPAAR